MQQKHEWTKDKKLTEEEKDTVFNKLLYNERRMVAESNYHTTQMNAQTDSSFIFHE